MKLSRFALRDLFWLVLVVAMGCAWWMDHRRLADVATPVLVLADEMKRIGSNSGSVYFDVAGFEIYARASKYHYHEGASAR